MMNEKELKQIFERNKIDIAKFKGMKTETEKRFVIGLRYENALIQKILDTDSEKLFETSTKNLSISIEKDTTKDGERIDIWIHKLENGRPVKAKRLGIVDENGEQYYSFGFPNIF